MGGKMSTWKTKFKCNNCLHEFEKEFHEGDEIKEDGNCYGFYVDTGDNEIWIYCPVCELKNHIIQLDKPAEMQPEKYPRTWEKISLGMYRLKVPGGWVFSEEGDEHTSNCFIPDQNHEWILEEEKK